jgi:hypothetical protein
MEAPNDELVGRWCRSSAGRLWSIIGCQVLRARRSPHHATSEILLVLVLVLEASRNHQPSTASRMPPFVIRHSPIHQSIRFTGHVASFNDKTPAREWLKLKDTAFTMLENAN